MKKPKPEAWRLSVPVARLNVEALETQILALVPEEDAPTLSSLCPDDDNAPDDWVTHAYFQKDLKPEVFRHLPPHSYGPVYPEDWVTVSQAGLQPIKAGRFYVYTQATAETAPNGGITLRIEAGQAFGTGQHATTAGCLATIDLLAKSRKFKNILDLGTGTGLLGFAAQKMWKARVIASDIDALSIEVAKENAALNDVPQGTAAHKIELVTADGFRHPRLKARAPYDLILANILARPLIDLSGEIVRALAPGGTLVLAGLLTSQEAAVRAAYTSKGLKFVRRVLGGPVSDLNTGLGHWPALTLTKPI
jgi:ribosomal protein L11 methyltransferase